jgi:hypothetical protein
MMMEVWHGTRSKLGSCIFFFSQIRNICLLCFCPNPQYIVVRTSTITFDDDYYYMDNKSVDNSLFFIQIIFGIYLDHTWLRGLEILKCHQANYAGEFLQGPPPIEKYVTSTYNILSISSCLLVISTLTSLDRDPLLSPFENLIISTDTVIIRFFFLYISSFLYNISPY